jgi:PPE-repeat protein
MDYGALPPEINSARMYAGPGPESMLAAAAAWNGLAGELHSAAASYGSVISELTGGPWVGPSSTAMEAAATPYVTWISATAGQAELAATQAQAAAGAYQSALTAIVPPATIATNRTQLAALTTTNVFGQNTAAIAANEAQYGEMWAQDAAAMYGYAANSAATTAKVTPFTAAPQTTNQAGSATQAAAATQATGTSTATGAQSTLSQLISSIQTALQSLVSPSTSTGTSTITTPGGIFSTADGFSLGGIASNLISSYAVMPAWMAIGLTSTMVGSTMGPLMGGAMNVGFTPAIAAANIAATQAAAAGAAGAAAAPAALGSGFGGLPGLGGLAGLGKAASVGALSVPSGWGWAATAPASLLGSAPLQMPAMPLTANDLAAGSGGFPLPFGGLGRAAAAAGAAGVAGAVGSKYLPRLSVVGRSPAAGYSPEGAAPATAKYPVPATFPTNGHAPPGYQPAIIYLPTNGQTNGHTNGHDFSTSDN